jgi:hypothetical protein
MADQLSPRQMLFSGLVNDGTLRMQAVAPQRRPHRQADSWRETGRQDRGAGNRAWPRWADGTATDKVRVAHVDRSVRGSCTASAQPVPLRLAGKVNLLAAPIKAPYGFACYIKPVGALSAQEPVRPARVAVYARLVLLGEWK